MIFKEKKHSVNLYNTLLYLSRNIFFYRDLQLEDNYETRIYLMFFHYSIILYIMKQRGNKPDQVNYNNLFFNIENNLRELGFGDVSVNKKMKDLNKIFYDILIKFNDSSTDFKLNKNLITKYFVKLKDNDDKFNNFSRYFSNFYTFCFEIPSENMIHNTQKYKF
tara:strand:- start:258 stop:749 length:492 start_codon:yes stop_codon:yes gene_type:complete